MLDDFIWESNFSEGIKKCLMIGRSENLKATMILVLEQSDTSNQYRFPMKDGFTKLFYGYEITHKNDELEIKILSFSSKKKTITDKNGRVWNLYFDK
jgi:hypothetical protein